MVKLSQPHMMKILLALVSVGFGCTEPAGGREDDVGDDIDGDMPPIVDPPEDLSEAVFDPDRVLEVEIELDEADWDTLRFQTRSFDDIVGANCLTAPAPNPFMYVPADVTIDGETIENVGVRKKGFFGSLSEDRPSLKVKLQEYVQGQTYSGVKRFTFNNNRQDPSQIKQCVGYQILADIGVPAPRCNFAHVTVNGVDLGVYTHVEAIKKDFLARHFDDSSGNLYEGALSDFRPDWVNTFERKNNEHDPDQSDLDAMVSALTLEDATLLDELSPILNIDAFIDFWVGESLIAHWDGYAGNTNNFYLYADPESGQFHFIPWGIDAILFTNPGAPASVIARGILAHHLYRLPETQGRYIDRLLDHLETVWDSDALVAETERMHDLLRPFVEVALRAEVSIEIAKVRGFLEERRDTILAELEDGPVAWDQPLRGAPCIVPLGEITGTFDTTWGTVGVENPFVVGAGTLAGTVSDLEIEPTTVSATSGLDSGPKAGKQPPAVIQILAVMPDDTILVAHLIVANPATIVAGATLPLQIGGNIGVLLRFDPAAPKGARLEQLGLLFEGSITFEEADTIDGNPIRGSVTSEVVEWGF